MFLLLFILIVQDIYGIYNRFKFKYFNYNFYEKANNIIKKKYNIFTDKYLYRIYFLVYNFSSIQKQLYIL